MVARIIKGKDILGLLKYNEKEKSGVLYSQYINDFKETDALTLKDKAEALQAYIQLNPGIAKPTFHVSLNPDPADKLNDGQLAAIGRDYMAGMKYGDQPYLIYKHEDIDRVHIHIVSVNIGLDGKAIDSSHERYRSEEVRKRIEVRHQLVKAGDKIRKGQNAFEPIDLKAIEYGRTDTKSAIATVVRSAVRDYRFCSMSEFRALLNYYHVTVDEVKDGGEENRTIGLCYAICNGQGEKLSPRIKASQIAKAVCYEALSEKMARTGRDQEEGGWKTTVSQKIIQALDAYPKLSYAGFKAHLAGQGIGVVYGFNAQKQLYDVTFIDYASRTVVGGQRLAPAFPVHTLNERLAPST
jgi:hypothetical protein